MSRHLNRRRVHSNGDLEPKVAVTYSKGLIWVHDHARTGEAILLLAHLFGKTEEEVRSDLDDLNG